MRRCFALFLLAGVAAAGQTQTTQEFRWPELTVLAPADLAAVISNFSTDGIPRPPYALPDPDSSLYIGSTLFVQVTPSGDSLGQGTPLYAWGPMTDLVLARNVSGGRALGCPPVGADTLSDIANGAEIAGRIALIARGTCSFYIKARNLQTFGAVGFIVFNPPDRVPDHISNMGGGRTGGVFISIPGVILPWALARPIVEAFEAGRTVNAKMACDKLSFGCIIDAGEGGPTASGAGLFVAGPNPSRDGTRLALRAPSPEAVTVTVHDAVGRAVAMLFDGMAHGEASLSLPAGLAAGVYFVRAAAATIHHVQQVTVMR